MKVYLIEQTNVVGGYVCVLSDKRKALEIAKEVKSLRVYEFTLDEIPEKSEGYAGPEFLNYLHKTVFSNGREIHE